MAILRDGHGGDGVPRSVCSYRAAHLDAPDCGDDDLDMSAANGKLGNSFE